MKNPLLLTLATLTALGANAFSQDSTPAPPAPPAAPAAPTPPTPPKRSKAVITFDVDGHQETREIDLDHPGVISLGKNQEIKIRTDGDRSGPHREQSVYIGVTPDSVPDEVRAQLSLEPGSGIILRGVSANGPAARAGLQKNDVLTKFDDQLLLSEHQFRLLIKGKHDGDTVHIAYLRRGQPGVVEVTLSTQESTDWTRVGSGPGDFQFSFDDNGSFNSEELSKNVHAVVSNAMKSAADSLNQSKAIVMDKAGKMVKLIGEDMVDTDTALDAVDKAMHRANLDEKTIADTKRMVAEELKRNEHHLEKLQDGLKKAADNLKKAADAQAKAADKNSNDEDDN